MKSERYLKSKVSGSPYQPGQQVKVVDAIDIEIHDVSMHIGKTGVTKALYYPNESGYPSDPIVVVEFLDGSGEGFWPEEITPLVILVA
jgi:hypothetical protein